VVKPTASHAAINALIPSDALFVFGVDFGGGIVGIAVLVLVSDGVAGLVELAGDVCVFTGFPEPSRTGLPLLSVNTVDALLEFTAERLDGASLNVIIFSP